MRRSDYQKVEGVESVLIEDGDLVLLGTPRDDDEGHNCDAMSCSSLSHVLLRVPLYQCDVGFTLKEGKKDA
jgi:hypothetical protein